MGTRVLVLSAPISIDATRVSVVRIYERRLTRARPAISNAKSPSDVLS